jgi:hypothetical protein
MLTFDTSTANSMEIDPQLHADLHEAFDGKPYVVQVAYGYRSFALQQQFRDELAAGKRPGPVAPAGESAHNYQLAGQPCAQAVDIRVIPAESGARVTWDTAHPAWQDVFATVLAHPRLHSGHAFGDDDHIETVAWANHIKPFLIASGQWGKPWPTEQGLA